MTEAAHPFPPELLDQLHAAGERLHASREEWEKSLMGVEYRHDERVDAARQKLREAETEIEAVEARITAELKTMR